MVAAARLARMGRKVTVVEQHYSPGGCATIFYRKHLRFEVRLRALDGLDDGDPKLSIFNELEILDHVKLVQIPRTQFFRFKHPEVDIVVPANVEGAIATLSRRFPAESRRIREF